MSDFALFAVDFANAYLIGFGTWLAYRVARLADRPPLGWVLITAAFGIAFARALVRLYTYLYPPIGADSLLALNDYLELPVVLLIISGVYLMYRDFRRHMKESQAELLAPGAPLAPAPEPGSNLLEESVGYNNLVESSLYPTGVTQGGVLSELA